jgi:dihydrodipicolinate synthase/N-acetylneuraminate lyase
MRPSLDTDIAAALRCGLVIPACPLALTAGRQLDERRQRALVRYYLAAGAGGLAIGVHTTQFAIHDPRHGLLPPVLALTAEVIDRAERGTGRRVMRIAGACGPTRQAVAEAESARDGGYHAALLSLGAWPDATDDELIAHCRRVGEVISLVGFYLQPAAGGRVLPYAFWRRLLEEVESLVAIKIAPFNRYQTLDVVRAAAESGRDDVALYTGNDDNFVLDLLTPFRIRTAAGPVERRIVGGLLGQWAVWTRRAVALLDECHQLAAGGRDVPVSVLRQQAELTDANAAIFDAANGFAGCIPGIHEVLRRQGLLEGVWCLDPGAVLSPGQAAEIDRVCRAYPHLTDDDFVGQHLDEWLCD